MTTGTTERTSTRPSGPGKPGRPDVRRARKAKARARQRSNTIIGHHPATPFLLSLPAILMISALLAFPVIYAVWGSFFDTEFLGGPQNFVGVDNYVELFRDPEFLSSIWKTFVFVFGTLAIGMALGVFFGFALHRATGKLRILRGLTIVPYLVSGVATAVMFRLLLNQDFGYVNRFLGFFGITGPSWFSDGTWAMVAAVLAQVWADLPLVVLLILGGLQTIDPQLLEAAEVDGATGWTRATRISLPLIMPQLLLGTILLSYQALTSLGVIIGLTGGGPVGETRTLPIALYETAFVDLETNEALAIVVVILLFNALLTLGYLGISRRYNLEDS
jgi:multiple sugar transport system permease protein